MYVSLATMGTDPTLVSVGVDVTAYMYQDVPGSKATGPHGSDFRCAVRAHSDKGEAICQRLGSPASPGTRGAALSGS